MVELESGLTGHSNGPTKPISSRSTSSTSRTAGREEKDRKATVTFASNMINKGESFLEDQQIEHLFTSRDIFDLARSIAETDYPR